MPLSLFSLERRVPNDARLFNKGIAMKTVVGLVVVCIAGFLSSVIGLGVLLDVVVEGSAGVGHEHVVER